MHGAALSHLANLFTVNQRWLELVANAAVTCRTVAVEWLLRVTVLVDRVLIRKQYESKQQQQNEKRETIGY